MSSPGATGSGDPNPNGNANNNNQNMVAEAGTNPPTDTRTETQAEPTTTRTDRVVPFSSSDDFGTMDDDAGTSSVSFESPGPKRFATQTSLEEPISDRGRSVGATVRTKAEGFRGNH